MLSHFVNVVLFQTHFPATSLKVPDKNIFLWPGSGNKGEVLEKNHIPFETFQVNWHQPDTHSSGEDF